MSQSVGVAASPADVSRFAIRELPKRGRGIVATQRIPAGSLVCSMPPDMCTLYSTFAGHICAHCYRDCGTMKNASNVSRSPSLLPSAGAEGYCCPTCDQFILCGACAEAFADEVAHRNKNGESFAQNEMESGNTAAADSMLASSLPPQRVLWLRRHPQLRLHALSCAWYNELPASVRAPGLDTDMLRFCLDYGSRCYYASLAATANANADITDADGGVKSAFWDAWMGCSDADNAALAAAVAHVAGNIATLDAAADVQSADVLHFCLTFARDKIVKTFGPREDPPNRHHAATTASSSPPAITPRYPVDAELLRGVLLRTQVNSLGFPFDAHHTLGWSLERTVCMLNHSCRPNAVVLHVPPNAATRSDAGGEHAAPVGSGSRQEGSGAGDSRHSGSGAWIGIRATREIAAGEELTISYVDLITYGGDVRERTRALLERYRFVCACSRCIEQRGAAQRQKAGVGVTKRLH